MPKVLIGTPAYQGKVNADYTQSLIIAAQHCAKHKIDMGSIILGNGAFIELARNAIIRTFLDSDYTHLMFIDADIAFPEHAIAGLVAGPPVSAGMYRKRDKVEQYQIRFPEGVINEKDGWVEADRLPAGFMCIERFVLEEMAKRVPLVKNSNAELPWVFRTEVSESFIGEDYCFCDDYTKLYKEGVFEEPIWVWPDLDLVHDGRLGNFHQYLICTSTNPER